MPSLHTTFTADASNLFAVMGKVQSKIRTDMARDLANWAVTGVAPNPLGVKFGDRGDSAARNFISRFIARMQGTGSGSMAQLVSVVSNTLSSLGSGINPFRILAQQGPNIAQAFITMSDDVVGLFKRLIVNPVTGILAGLAIGAVAAWKLVSTQIEMMTSYKVPDLGLDRVAAYLQRTTQAQHVQQAIENSIRKSADHYFSAAAGAERLAKATASQFDHARKMVQLSNLPEAEKARREAALNAEERQVELRQKAAEQEALIVESRNKQRVASDLLTSIPSEEIEKQTIAQRKSEAEAAKAKVEEFNKAKVNLWDDFGPIKGTSMRDLQEAYTKLTNLTKNTVSVADLRAAEQTARQAQTDAEAAYKRAVDATGKNKLVRARGEDMAGQAAAAAARASEIGVSLPSLRAIAEQATANEQAVLRAKLASMPQAVGDLTANQRVGAFSLGTATTANMHLKAISAQTAKANGLLETIAKTLPDDVNRNFQ